MRVSVCEKEVAITEMSIICEGDYGVNVCTFDLPASFDGLSVTAVFNGISVPLVNQMCIVPSLKKGNAVLGVFAYKRINGELQLVYSPKPTVFYVSNGSFCDESAKENVPEISRFDEFCGMLADYCTEQIKDHCNLKKIQNPEITELEYGVYTVYGNVIYSADEKKLVNVASGVLFVLPTTDGENNGDKYFYLFSGNENIYKGIGRTSEGFIEEIPHLVNSVTVDGSDKTFPSSKAVYDFVLGEYIADSDRPISCKAIEDELVKRETAISSKIYENTANALNGKVSGMINIVNDIAPDFRNVSVRLRNIENMCSLGSVEFTNCITVKNAVVIPKGKYVFSAVVSSCDTDADICVVHMKNSKSGYIKTVSFKRSSANVRIVRTVELTDDIDELAFYASDTYNDGKGDFASFADIMIENEGGTGEYKPYTDLSSVKVSVCGKNLFSDFIKSKTYSDGSVITVKDDGSVNCNMVDGTSVSNEAWIRLPAGTYTISDGIGGKSPYIAAIFYDNRNDNSTWVAEINTKSKSSQTVTTDKTCDVKLLLYTSSSVKSMYKLYPQLEVGNSATVYERYKTVHEYYSTENGNVTVNSEYPNMTVFTDAEAINVETAYNKDTNKAFEELKNAIISLGGNI